jgi:hypothetical protein
LNRRKRPERRSVFGVDYCPAKAENWSAKDILASPSITILPLLTVHQLDASQDILGRLERLESEHRFSDTFDGPMILLDDVIVIEVFDLTNVRGMGGRMRVD